MRKYIFVSLIAAAAPFTALASFDRSLSYGSKGADVEQLQKILVSENCLSTQPTGYFGMLTLAGVKCFQTKHNLPSSGYFGNLTRSQANSIISALTASSTIAYSVETGTISGAIQPNCPAGNNCTRTTSGQPAATTSTTVNKVTPYQGQDGNWYYPNTRDSNGKAIQAATAKIVALPNDNSSNSLTTTNPIEGKYSGADLLNFNLISQNSNAHIRNLTVRFSVKGGARITTAYLYQAGTPVLSAQVSNNTATFTIPDGTPGATLGANIPTLFSVNGDVSGVSLETCSAHVDGSPDYTFEQVVPFSIASYFNAADLALIDNAGNAIMTFGSASSTLSREIHVGAKVEMVTGGLAYKCPQAGF